MNLISALLFKLEVDEKSHEFLSVLRSDGDVAPVWNELDLLTHSDVLNIYAEGSAEHVFQLDSLVFTLLVLKNLLHRLGSLWLPLLQIFEFDFLAEKNLVASRHYWHVDKKIVIEGNAHQHSD